MKLKENIGQISQRLDVAINQNSNNKWLAQQNANAWEWERERERGGGGGDKKKERKRKKELYNLYI